MPGLEPGSDPESEEFIGEVYSSTDSSTDSDDAPIRPGGLPIPVVPPLAILPVVAGVNLGIANPVGVLSGEAFATSWNGLGYMIDLPLKNGGG